MSRAPVLATLAIVGVAASGCSLGSPGPQARATQAEIGACRSRADEVYLKQNRDEIYRADTFASTTRDAPFAGAGIAGTASSGLSGQYARDQLYTDCLRNAPSNVGAVQGDVVPPAPPK